MITFYVRGDAYHSLKNRIYKKSPLKKPFETCVKETSTSEDWSFFKSWTLGVKYAHHMCRIFT